MLRSRQRRRSQEIDMNTKKKNQKAFQHKCGITYFTKKTERNLLFFMTLAMLLWGIVEKVIQ